MHRYWISWYQTTADMRPMTVDNKNSGLIEWWCSGGRMSDDAHTLCAVVEAESEEAAEKVIQSKLHWPEAEEWRFCNEEAMDYMPDPGRFPPAKKA